MNLKQAAVSLSFTDMIQIYNSLVHKLSISLVITWLFVTLESVVCRSVKMIADSHPWLLMTLSSLTFHGSQQAILEDDEFEVTWPEKLDMHPLSTVLTRDKSF